MALFSGATALRLPRPDQALPGRDDQGSGILVLFVFQGHGQLQLGM